MVGVFDRSHYEDVLVARVHELADEAEIERRYGAINDFEKGLVDDGHGGHQVHAAHLRREAAGAVAGPARRPREAVEVQARRTSTSGLTGRDYQQAYEIALERCNTDAAPWYVVPSDHKWYRNWAVGQLLLEALRGMKLEWPEPDYDVDGAARATGGESETGSKTGQR